MKKVILLFVFGFGLGLWGWGQTHFYSTGSNNINLLNSWNTQPDGTGSSPSNFTANSQIFNVQSGHNMTASAQLTVSGTGSKVQIKSGGQITSGAFNHSLTLDMENGATWIHTNTTYSSLTFGSLHANSNFQLNNSSGFAPTRTYPNLIVNNVIINPGTTGINVNGSLDIRGVSGDFRGTSTGTPTHNIAGSILIGNSAKWTITNGTGAPTYNIGGTITNNGGSIINGTSPGLSILNMNGTNSQTITWGSKSADKYNFNIANGKVVLFADNFSINTGLITVNGTLGLGNTVVSGNGSIIVNTDATIKCGHSNGLSGSITLSGTKTFSNGANYIFNGSTDQLTGDLLTAAKNIEITNTSGKVSLSTNVTLTGTLTIPSGTIFDAGTKVISGSGDFDVQSGATLITAHSGGLNGSNTTSGGISLYNEDASYTFNGSSAQVTGTYLPATVSNLTVDNAAGLTLSNSSLTVSGTLTINSGKKLEIGADKRVTAESIDNNGGTSGLVIKSSASSTGSLINNTPGVSATVERYIEAIPSWYNSESGWHMLSSPVVTETIGGDWTPSLTAPNRYDFYAWSETATSQNWRNQKDVNNGITDFVPGMGYFVAYEITATKSFTDVLNAESVALSNLTHTTGNTYAGWHLLGNPYPCAISWSSGSWIKDNLGLYPQIWNSAAKSYKVLAGSGQGIIPAMSGFMVYVMSGGGSLTIPEDSKVHSDSTWYKSSGSDMITLSVVDLDQGGAQETILHFSGSGYPGFNEMEDCQFLVGFAPKFYTMADNHRLALNTLSGLTPETEVNLWFEKNQSTRFFLRLDVSDVDAQVLLTDLKTGQSVNLTQDKSYPFTSDAADSPDRFRLHFSHVGTPEMKSSQEIRIFSDTRGIVIRNRQGQIFDGEVFVYNMLGQLAFQSELNGSSIYSLPPINSGSSHGYFIVKLMTGNHILTGKIFNTLYTN